MDGADRCAPFFSDGSHDDCQTDLRAEQATVLRISDCGVNGGCSPACNGRFFRMTFQPVHRINSLSFFTSEGSDQARGETKPVREGPNRHIAAIDGF